jgi:hypothetical protein
MQSVPLRARIKFHALNSLSIVGSEFKDAPGETLSFGEIYKLNDPYNRRIKRLIDITIALSGVITFPFQLMIQEKPFTFLANCFAVLFAQKTWVGYTIPEKDLPHLRKAIIGCNGNSLKSKQLPKAGLQKLDRWYAKEYEPFGDLKLIFKSYRQLGK